MGETCKKRQGVNVPIVVWLLLIIFNSSEELEPYCNQGMSVEDYFKNNFNIDDFSPKRMNK